MTIDVEQIKRELVTVVRNKSAFDEGENTYSTELNKSQRLALENNFSQWLNQKLLFDGAHKDHVKKNYKILTLLFHPDRISLAFPEIAWIEKQLSEGRNHGACFSLLTTCHEKLTQPEQFKPVHFNGINSKEDCRRWFEREKEKSRRYSYRCLCNHLIGLLDESDLFFDTTGTLKPQAVKVLVQFIPTLITTYGLTLIMEELFAIYLLYFFILKGGKQLENSDYYELRMMGRYIQQYTAVAALTNTALIAYFIEMIFWSSRHCLDYSVQLGTQLLTSLPASNEYEMASLQQESQLTELHKASSFQHPELKLIALPFEKYLIINKTQYLADWQLSRNKRKAVNRFLFQLHVYDQRDDSVPDKIVAIKELLNEIKNDRQLYTHKTAEAVNYAERIVGALEAGVVTGLADREIEENNQLVHSTFFK